MWKYLKRRCEESNEFAWGVAVGGVILMIIIAIAK